MKEKARPCQNCGRPANYTRPKAGTVAGRDDHDLCRRCWQKHMEAVRAKEMQELPDQPVK
jgi:hypothetical protein